MKENIDKTVNIKNSAWPNKNHKQSQNANDKLGKKFCNSYHRQRVNLPNTI